MCHHRLNDQKRRQCLLLPFRQRNSRIAKEFCSSASSRYNFVHSQVVQSSFHYLPISAFGRADTADFRGGFQRRDDLVDAACRKTGLPAKVKDWYKRVRPSCICFYCICRRARVGLRRILYPFRRVTAHASRNSAHDGEGERKRGLVTVVHRVNYTISAAGRVGFRGRFRRRVSVVRREQIRVLIKTAPLPVHPRCGRPLVGGYAQSAAQTAA